MTKLKLTRALFLGAIVLGLFLAGCDTGLSPSGSGSPELNSGTTGTVTLNVGLEGLSQTEQGAALTVKPADTALAGVTYKATFTGGATPPAPVELKSGSNKLTLPVGTYGIKVDASLDIEDVSVVIATKSFTGVTVSVNADTNRTFILPPKAGAGNGSFSYSITVPEGLASGTLKIPGTSLANVDLTNEDYLSGDAVVLAAGTYTVTVTLTRGTGDDVEYAGFVEALSIYAGLESALPASLSTFSDGDFSAQVGAIDLALAFAAPETGAVPVWTLPPTADYTGVVEWKDSEEEILAEPAKGKEGTVTFKGEETYTATVTLTAKDGKTFTGIPAYAGNDTDLITYEDADSVAYNAGSGSKMEVTVGFDATPAAEVSLLDLSALITAPVTGAVSQTAFTATAEYAAEGNITWTDALIETNKFNGETVYTATVVLNAKAGYVFGGENIFSHGSNEVTNEEPTAEGKTATVIIVFPETDSSDAQKALDYLGLSASEAEATGLTEVTVKDNVTITAAPTPALPATVSIVVDTGKTLTVDTITLTVPGTLKAGNGSLAVANNGKFATTGTGSVDVTTEAQFKAVTAAAGNALAVTVSDSFTLSDATELKAGTKLTVGATALTVSGALSGAGTLATTPNNTNSKVILSGASTGANFEWALKAANAIEKLELGANTTLADAEQPVTVTVPAKTEVTMGSYTLTVPAKKTLSVAGMLAGTGAVTVDTLTVPQTGTLNLTGTLNVAGSLNVAGTVSNLATLVDSKADGGATITFNGATPVTVGAYTAKAADNATTFEGSAALTITALTDIGSATKVVFNGTGAASIGTLTTVTGGTATIDGTGAVELGTAAVATVSGGNLVIAGTGLKTIVGNTVTIAASTSIDASAGRIKFGDADGSVTLEKAKLISGSAGTAAVAANGAVTLAFSSNAAASASLELGTNGTIATAGTGVINVGTVVHLKGDGAVFTASAPVDIKFGGDAASKGAIIGKANGAIFAVGGTNGLILLDGTAVANLAAVTLDLSASGTLTVTSGGTLTLGVSGTAGATGGILLSSAVGLVGSGAVAPTASGIQAPTTWVDTGTGTQGSSQTKFVSGVITGAANGGSLDNTKTAADLEADGS